MLVEHGLRLVKTPNMMVQERQIVRVNHQVYEPLEGNRVTTAERAF
jgi:hypothetical protein